MLTQKQLAYQFIEGKLIETERVIQNLNDINIHTYNGMTARELFLVNGEFSVYPLFEYKKAARGEKLMIVPSSLGRYR